MKVKELFKFIGRCQDFQFYDDMTGQAISTLANFDDDDGSKNLKNFEDNEIYAVSSNTDGRNIYLRIIIKGGNIYENN